MKRFRLLGFLPLAFFLAQAIHYWHINEFGQVFWMCNIGNLLLAIGIFSSKHILIRVAAIWMVPGVAVWVVYVVPTWGTLLTRAGKPRSAIWSSFFDARSSGRVFSWDDGIAQESGWMGVPGSTHSPGISFCNCSRGLSRLAPMNVNVSQQIQAGWEQTFSAYWKFWLVLTLLVGICLFVLGSS